MVTIGSDVYLAISDFLNTHRTYLIHRDKVPQLNQSSLPELATICYRNGAFSQGLTWDGRYLYEAIGNRSTDRIEVYDVTQALVQGDSALVRNLGSFTAPGKMVEDMATDGRRLWTSDEHSYHWYVLPDLPDLLSRLQAAEQR